MKILFWIIDKKMITINKWLIIERNIDGRNKNDPLRNLMLLLPTLPFKIPIDKPTWIVFT